MWLQLAAPRQRVRLLEAGDAGNSEPVPWWTVFREGLRWYVNERRIGRPEQQGENPTLES